jgi:galactose mutarotase-like enzyme
MRVEPFGGSSIGPVRAFTIGAEPGPVLEVLDLGATVHRLGVTCGDGVRRNVVLGHPTPEDHLTSPAYLGGTIGRYANRIAGGRFDLDGRVVQLETNDRGNTLHGGPAGFDKRMWEVVDHGDDHVVMRLVSPGGDQGFPGRLVAQVRFEISGESVLVLFRAASDASTVVCLTSHAYFNLDGADTIEEHLLRVDAEEFLPIDDTGIPLADRARVAGTAFDLRRPSPLGERIRDPHPQMAAAQGIDHCFVLDGAGQRRVATLDSRLSRTRLELITDQPGLQVYTGSQLDGTLPSVSGGAHPPGAGIALEPELFPDTPNSPAADTAVLRPGETYEAALEWRFSALGADGLGPGED